MIRRILRNDYGLNFLNKVYTICIGVLSTAFLTRYLGLDLKGDYAFILQVANVAALVLDMGLSQTYSFFYRRSGGKVLRGFLNIYALQFLVYLVLATAISVVFRNTVYTYICLLVPFTVSGIQMESTMAVERIRLKIKLHMWNATISMLCYAGLFFFKDSVGHSLVYPILVTVGVRLIALLVYMRSLRILPRPLQTDYGFLQETVQFSWLPMVTALFIALNYSVDLVLLKYMGTPLELSLYSVAAGIMSYFWLIPDAFKEVLVSRVTRSDGTKSTNLAMKYSVASVVGVIIVFAVLGKLAIRVLYGTDFVGSYGVTLLLSLGVVSMVFFKLIGVLLLAEGQRWFYFWVLAASVVVNIAVNLVLIPLWGMYGAAIASVISYSLCGGAFLAYYLRSKGIRFADAVILRPRELIGALTRKAR